ncbi:unnamed protein product [Nesidiocoris tenuis]|uniref:Uncharacterized protein n=1 Tax=Nesidiocoris tenuis TaxID=355587 RepID=A0A6H5GIE7_9HEMI|nr:unnamed protein product [Nesidiocoris tenuis]
MSFRAREFHHLNGSVARPGNTGPQAESHPTTRIGKSYRSSGARRKDTKSRGKRGKRLKKETGKPPAANLRSGKGGCASVCVCRAAFFYFTVKQIPKQTRMFDSCASGNMKQIASQAPRFTNTTTSDKDKLKRIQIKKTMSTVEGVQPKKIPSSPMYARRRRFLTNFILKDAPYRRPLLFIDCRQAYKPEYNWNSSRITSPTCFIRLQGGKRYWQAVPPLKFGQPIQNGSLPVKRAYNRIVNYAIGTSTASTVSSVNTCSTNNGTNVQFVTPHWSKLYKPLDMRRRLGGKRRTDSNKGAAKKAMTTSCHHSLGLERFRQDGPPQDFDLIGMDPIQTLAVTIGETLATLDVPIHSNDIPSLHESMKILQQEVNQTLTSLLETESDSNGNDGQGDGPKSSKIWEKVGRFTGHLTRVN